jgi:hypothetical protein
MHSLHTLSHIQNLTPRNPLTQITRLGVQQNLQAALVHLSDLATRAESSAQHEALTSRIERIKSLLNQEQRMNSH